MEPIKANEINEIIRAQIQNFEAGVTVAEVGSVIKVGDGIAEVHGLEKVMAGELLAFPHEVSGLALNLEENRCPWVRRWLAEWSTRLEIPSTSAGQSSPKNTTPSSVSPPA
jgi:hypothetical protein